MASTKNPLISIVIPVYNRPDLLAYCLGSIYSQKYKHFETLVIDDNSTENLKPIAKKYPVRYFYLKKNKGPGFARNFGVQQARGTIMVFIDSDVLANDGFLERIEDIFHTHKGIAAAQGTYTLIPYHTNFFSFFKNLTLYYHFNRNPRYANSIASFCTAIRKDVFLSNGGFDGQIKNASIEDEEFGIQLTRNGHKIIYDKGLQVKHMKKFTLYSLMRQDFRTGFDKVKSLLRKRNVFNQKELQGSHSSFSLLASIPLSALIVFNILMLFVTQSNAAILALIFLLGIFTLINHDYLSFLLKNQEFIPFIPAFIFSIFDYFSIQMGIVFGFIHYLMGNKY